MWSAFSSTTTLKPAVLYVGEKMGGKLGKEFMSVAFRLCELPSNMT
jgi:hypothetical protein